MGGSRTMRSFAPHRAPPPIPPAIPDLPERTAGACCYDRRMATDGALLVIRSLTVVVPISLAAAGCAPPPPPPKPPDKPPSPKSITIANPGGDAADPELASLQLLERGAWGKRRDRLG